MSEQDHNDMDSWRSRMKASRIKAERSDQLKRGAYHVAGSPSLEALER